MNPVSVQNLPFLGSYLPPFNYTDIHNFLGGSDGGSGYSNLIQNSSNSLLYGTTQAGNGTIFSCTTSGSLTNLHTLTGSDGSGPENSLVQDSGGTLYGIANGGGAHSNGCIFSCTTSSVTYTVLYAFSSAGTTDGKNPSSIILGADGNLYGCCVNGGAYSSHGTIWRCTTGGSFTLLASTGGPGTYGIKPNGGLIQGSDGNLYGTCFLGNSGYLGSVWKCTTAGAYTELYAASLPFNNFVGPIIQANNGYLYGVTENGGANGIGGLWKCSTSGTISSVHSFATLNGTWPYGGVTQASDGNLYGTAPSGGANSVGTIWQYITSGAGQFNTLYPATSGGGNGYSQQLLQASDSNLYGLATSGGTHSYGTIFRIIL